MKQSLILAILFNFLFVGISSAKIIRVNNNGIPADYTSFSDAQSAAVNGDTIHLEPSGVSYGTLYITKQLIIIGNGYFLNENMDLQHNTSPSIVGNILLYATGSGTSLIGITIKDASVTATSQATSNYTFLRCHFDNSYYYTQYSYVVDDLLFDGCYFTRSSGGISMTSSVGTEALFKNCYFEMPNISLNSSANGIFSNCIFNLSGGITVSNYHFSNCILVTGDLTDEGANSYDNNLCNLAQFPAGNGNLRLVDMNTVFEGYPNQGGNSTDGRWELATGSPASGAGIGGIDCGIFGGVGAYKLSGIPPIPTIYNLVAPASAGNSIQVIISTRVNN